MEHYPLSHWQPTENDIDRIEPPFYVLGRHARRQYRIEAAMRQTRRTDKKSKAVSPYAAAVMSDSSIAPSCTAAVEIVSGLLSINPNTADIGIEVVRSTGHTSMQIECDGEKEHLDPYFGARRVGSYVAYLRPEGSSVLSTEKGNYIITAPQEASITLAPHLSTEPVDITNRIVGDPATVIPLLHAHSSLNAIPFDAENLDLVTQYSEEISAYPFLYRGKASEAVARIVRLKIQTES